MKRLVVGLIMMCGLFIFNPTESSAALGDRALKPGMSHPDVKELQQVLKKKGYFSYKKTTNYYGTYTKSAVKKFQKSKRIKVDGYAGPQTLKALGVSKKSTASSKASSSKAGSKGVINTAKKYSGVPYVWGGTTPRGFDCSGFLNYVYKEALGVNLPRTVAGIYSKGKKVSSPKAGDIVFFQTYKKGPSHAGIYIGNNKFIHSGSSTGVSIASLKTSYWSKRYLGSKRIN